MVISGDSSIINLKDRLLKMEKGARPLNHPPPKAVAQGR